MFRPRAPLSIAVFGLLVTQALVWMRYASGPEARGPDAPSDVVSAGRAVVVLERLLGDGRPHPVGSPANRAVRERLVAEIEGLGFEPQIQVGRTGVLLENVLVRVPGRERGRPLMLATHYDSVPEGPGASDPGACVVALLEVMRVLKAEFPFRNDIIFAFTDGEEPGLLGARLFVRDHPWARDEPLVLNFDARGTRGPSLMYETGAVNDWLVDHFAGIATRPVTGSAFVAVYDKMPNATDFTIFKSAGWTGLNFAFIGGPTWYHTAEDDLAHLDPRSLQHHADQALGLARTLGDADLSNVGGERAEFFDVLSTFIVSWPEPWSIWLAGAMLALSLVSMFVLWSRQSIRLGHVVKTGVVALLAIVLAAGIGHGVSLALTGADLLSPRGFVEPAWPWVLVLWCVAFGLLWLCGHYLLRGVGYGSGTTAVWTLWSLLAVAAAILAPGASYPFLVPAALVVGFRLLCRVLRWRAPAAIAVWGALATGLLWLPILDLVPLALGLKLGALIAGLMAFALTPLLPLIATRRPEPGY